MSRISRRSVNLILALAVAISLIVPSVLIINAGQQPIDTGALTYYTEQFPPYNYEENGTLKGVAVDLLEDMTAKIGKRVAPEQIHLVPWTEGYETVLTSKMSVLFSMARLPERETSFKWVGPISTERYVLFAGWDRAIAVNNASDLNKYRIGVITDDAAVLQLQNAGVEASHMVFDTNASALVEKLARGEIDLWCYPEVVGRHIIQQVTTDYYSFRTVFALGDLGSYIAFSKDVPDATVRAFQGALDSLKREKDASGISAYERILGRYIPSIGLGQLTYLTEEWAPFNYLDEGKPSGLSVEILKAIFDAAGVNCTAEDVDIVPLSYALDQARGNTSTVVFSIVRTPEREPLYKWVGPFTRSSFVLYASLSRNITIGSAEDLDFYEIGAVQSSIENDLLIDQSVNASHIISGQTPGDLVQMLESEQIDLWATGDLTGRYEMERNGVDPNEYEIVYTLSENDFYFIFSRNVPDAMVSAFEHALQFVRQQKDAYGVSEYERIIYEYLGAGYARQTFDDAAVMALVNETAAAVGTNASDAFLHINAGEAPYKNASDAGLYAFVYDLNETIVAHADNPLLVGVNFKGKTDVTGKAFRDLIRSGALANGTGWVDYVYLNPAKTNLYYKTTYYKLVLGSDGDQYIICSGNYKSR